MQATDLDIENVKSQWIKISQYSTKSSRRRNTIAIKGGRKLWPALPVWYLQYFLGDQRREI